MTDPSATQSQTATHSLSEVSDYVWSDSSDDTEGAENYSPPAAAHDSEAAVDAEQAEAASRDLSDDDLGDLTGDDVRLTNDADLDHAQPGPLDYTTPSAGVGNQALSREDI